MVVETRAVVRRLLERDATLELPEHEGLRRFLQTGARKPAGRSRPVSP
jgi:hypothetical protein